MSSTQVIPGTLRETNNPLLLKASIGKPQIRGFLLPPEEFTYGLCSSGKTFGTADTFSWQTKLKPLRVKEQKSLKRDFISLNKSATQAGLVTAKEHFQYRATHDVKSDENLLCDKMKPIKYPSPATVFGVPTRPSTPVFDLLEHKYQDKWLAETHRNEVSRRTKEREQKKSAHKGYSETCASRLRRYYPKVDPAPLWQMPRFQKNALPTLQTFRSVEAREKAFRNHSSDCTARTGVFGHGTYEGAKS